MSKPASVLVLLAGVGLVAFALSVGQPQDQPAPDKPPCPDCPDVQPPPVPPVPPVPTPPPVPDKPKRPRRPWADGKSAAVVAPRPSKAHCGCVGVGCPCTDQCACQTGRNCGCDVCFNGSRTRTRTYGQRRGEFASPPCSAQCACGCNRGDICSCEWPGAEEYRRKEKARRARLQPVEPEDGDDYEGELLGMDDAEPMVDLLAIPSEGRPRNVGGRDGAGLCVFTSIQYAAWYQGETRLKDFQAKMRSEPGGGYPEKVDRMIAKYGAGTRYVQYQGKDPKVIELGLKTRRPVSITWNANHMLSCVHLDASRGALLDNNDKDRYHWYERSRFLSQWQRGGGGWCVILLSPPPPPPPAGITPLPRRRVYSQAPRRPLDNGMYWRPAPRPRTNGMLWHPSDEQPERWLICGKPATSQAAIRAIMGDLEDDSAKLCVTAIGPDAERKQVVNDFATNPALAAWKDRIHLKDYSPADWEVASGFVTTGRPTIYFETPAGRVLWRQDDYKGGAGALATALRKKDPTYDPKKDPGPNTAPVAPTPASVPSAGSATPVVPLVGLAALLAGGVLLLWRKK